MGDQVIMRAAAHFSEFTGDDIDGRCTQTAERICMGISENKPATQEEMVALYKDMLSRKLCAQNGAATVSASAEMARILGFPVELEWDFGQMGDWHKKLQENAGNPDKTKNRPILLQVANGAALKDVETGKADESGVHYHAIAVVGYCDQGYVCADGDNPEVSQRFQVYPYATLAAAQPCGLLILGMKVPIEPDLPEGAAMKGVDLEWDGFRLTGDFLAWQKTNNYRLGPPRGNLWMENTGEAFQTFEFGELRQAKEGNVFLANVGDDLIKLRTEVAALTKTLDKVRADLA